MKRIIPGLIVLLVSIFNWQCQKELSGSANMIHQPNNRPLPITATLQGNILDENGAPAIGVKISAGAKSTVTNAKGYFRLKNAPLDKNASLVVAEQPGYFKAYRSFRATEGVNQVVIQLIKKQSIGKINAVRGGIALLANGASVALPANGVMKDDGTPFTGDVNVYASYIDPLAPNTGNTVPGSFMADDKENSRVTLKSYGMMAVELESAAGEHLQVKPGNMATLKMPLSTAMASTAPETISLWYVDEATGLWKEQGTAKKTGNSYIGAVQHFSYWNCDIGIPAISISATFETAKGELLRNLTTRIVVMIDTTTRSAYGYTNSLGQVNGLVPANEKLVMQVLNDCQNIVFSKDIGPFSENTNLGKIVVPANTSSMITINGRIVSCNNTPVANGTAIVYWNNYVHYIHTDVDGKFASGFFVCSNNAPSSYDLVVVDEDKQQQGALQTISLSQSSDLGDVQACGTTSEQYVNYILDGEIYQITYPADSITSFTGRFGNGGFSNYSSISARRQQDSSVNFEFMSNDVPGIYALYSLKVRGFGPRYFTTGLKVNMTQFPKIAGDFFEGNINGNFKDSATATQHSINCTFRVRRLY